MTLCHVRSINPIPMEGFLGCAEPMLPMCQFKVKVTVKGQIYKQILDVMSCQIPFNQ